jgi:hypothetical protein
MDARTAYETFLRKRVSDTHWSSVKRTLTDSGMEITPDTVVFFAKLRKEIPRASVGILQVFECYQQAEKLLAVNSSKIKGSQILEILNGEGINPHPATISRWFKSLGGFRKTRLYFPEKLTRGTVQELQQALSKLRQMRLDILMKLINDHNSQSSCDEDLLKNALLAATANRQRETEDFFGSFENQLLEMRTAFGV